MINGLPAWVLSYSIAHSVLICKLCWAVVIRDGVALQREARSAKKELKTMFKEEAVKQHKRMAAPPSSIVPLS